MSEENILVNLNAKVITGTDNQEFRLKHSAFISSRPLDNFKSEDMSESLSIFPVAGTKADQRETGCLVSFHCLVP